MVSCLPKGLLRISLLFGLTVLVSSVPSHKEKDVGFNFEKLVGSMNAKEQLMFKQELARAVKRFGE